MPTPCLEGVQGRRRRAPALAGQQMVCGPRKQLVCMYEQDMEAKGAVGDTSTTLAVIGRSKWEGERESEK